MTKRETIAEADIPSGHVSVVKEDDHYNVCVDNVIRHPNCDAEAAIRALCFYLNGVGYKALKAGCV